MFILVFTVLCIMVILYAVVLYQRLLVQSSRQRNAWGQVDVDLKRRHDLIRSLVIMAREYLQHDDPVLENVSRARLDAIEAGSSIAYRARMESTLTEATRSLLALLDSYAELRDRPDVAAAQRELAATAERLGPERTAYNRAVKSYNAAIQRFPARYIAERLELEPAVPYEQSDTVDRLQPWVLQ